MKAKISPKQLGIRLHVVLKVLHTRVLWMLLMISCVICPKLLAEDNPDDWVKQTLTYSHRIGVGPTSITDYLYSANFTFTPTPGNYKAIVNFAHLDDNGSIGCTSAPVTMPDDCGWPHEPLVNAAVSSNAITVVGNCLRVKAIAVDNGCGNQIGWTDVSITWMAKCTSCS